MVLLACWAIGLLPCLAYLGKYVPAQGPCLLSTTWGIWVGMLQKNRPEVLKYALRKKKARVTWSWASAVHDPKGWDPWRAQTCACSQVIVGK